MRYSNFARCLLVFVSTLMLGGAAAAQLCPGDDVLEPNDDCWNPSLLSNGQTSPLNIKDGVDEDFFFRTVAHNERLIIVCYFSNVDGDIDVWLYDVNGTCVLSLAQIGQGPSDGHVLVYTNTSGVLQSIMLRVFRPTPQPNCQNYILIVDSQSSPCFSTPDDVYAPNQLCSTAATLTPGTYLGLQAFGFPRQDMWKIDVPNGATLLVDALFSHAGGDVDMRLYDQASLLNMTCGTSSGWIDSSFSTTDNESVSAINSSGATMSYYVLVDIYQGGDLECNSYDLVVSIPPPGTALCFGDGFSAGPCPCGNQSNFGAGEGCMSSLGYGSTLGASGSTSVSADDISFTVSQGRPNQPGMLLQGANLQQVQFKDGILCTGNPTERVEVVFLDGFGVATTTSSIVTNGNVSAGNTRWYQMWSRDPGGVSPCGTGSNFSHALAITYTP